jgi:hypothetical protein
MPSLLTRPGFTWLVLAAGAALRLEMIHLHPQVQGDALLYGDIAGNWLSHGIYGHTVGHPSGINTVEATLVRLPGYPAFLALCFAVFGIGHYQPVVFLQALIDLGTCWLAAGLARKLCGPLAGKIALVLAALCPFTAVYAAFPLTETLSIFCVALGFRMLVEVVEPPGSFPGSSPERFRSRWVSFFLLIFSWTYATLLRPDGALLAVVLCCGLVVYGRRSLGLWPAFRLALLGAVISVLPFVVWTARNWRTFHVFEPLAPRYANDPGEFAAPGFILWVKTFTVDFTTTSEIYWNGNSDRVEIGNLPSRAIDNNAQFQETQRLLNDYNDVTTLTPEIDQRFDRLARERIAASPLRYYVLLPLARLGNMWFRPRLETGNGDLRWWRYRQHPAQTLLAIGNAALNLAYVVLALLGIFRKPRFVGAMVALIVLRCLLLATIEAPETRYTMELFPLLFVLGACYLTTVLTSFGSFSWNSDGAIGSL